MHWLGLPYQLGAIDTEEDSFLRFARVRLNTMEDELKIGLVVTAPVAFFALLISIALAIRHKRLKKSPILPSHQPSTNDDRSPRCEKCQHVQHPKIPQMFQPSYIPQVSTSMTSNLEVSEAARRSSFTLPTFEEKVISVRRISADPAQDITRRFSSVSSTLTDFSDQDFKAAEATILHVTDMGGNSVGVERRISKVDFGPTDQRFLSALNSQPAIAREHVNEVNLVQPPQSAEILLSPIAEPPQHKKLGEKSTAGTSPTILQAVSPIPATSSVNSRSPKSPKSPRSPLKPKHRPDSLEIAHSRSPSVEPAPPLSEKSFQAQPGEIFKGWTGFDQLPTARLSFDLSAIPKLLPPRKSSMRRKSEPRITWLADVVLENERRKSLDGQLGFGPKVVRFEGEAKKRHSSL